MNTIKAYIDDVLFAAAVFTVGFCILIWAFDCYGFDEDYDYASFYTADYYEAHDREELFGSWEPMVKSYTVDWEHRVVFVELFDQILQPDDTTCRLFGYMMKRITSNDMLVYVTNKTWIPSAKNPIDYDWASGLAEP